MPIGVTSAELTFAPAPTGNGIRVVTTKGTFEINESNIPPNVINKTPEVVEAWVNDWLTNNTNPPPYMAVHIFSLNPLNLTLYTGDAPPPANWWIA